MAIEKNFLVNKSIDLDKILWYFIINKEKRKKWRINLMLNDEIRKKREELNKSIEENKNYEIIYKISVELDELIAEYYRNNKKIVNQ